MKRDVGNEVDNILEKIKTTTTIYFKSKIVN